MLRIVFAGDATAGGPILRRIAGLPGAKLAGLALAAGSAPPAGYAGPLLDLANLGRAEAATELASLAPDLFMNFNSTVVFPGSVLQASGLAVNFHPGPLPAYAGSFVYQWGIINGEREFGASIHVMEERVDAGDVLAEARFPLGPEDTGLTVYMRALNAGVDLLGNLVEDLAAGRTPARRPQDLAQRRFYPNKPPLGGTVNFGWRAAEVADFVRALSYRPFASPSGPPVTYLGQRPLELVKARAEDQEATGPLPGEVLEIAAEGILVQAGRGRVRITTLHDGRVAMPAADTARALGIRPGTRLGAAPRA